MSSRRLGGRAAGGTVSSRLYRVYHDDDVDKHCAQYFVNSLFLLSYSFVGDLSPLLMFLRVLRTRGLLSLGGMLY